MENSPLDRCSCLYTDGSNNFQPKQDTRDTKMTNPYTQPGSFVSTTTNWFNPNGVAHYATPVPRPDVDETTNTIVNAAIASR
jgi:hypothetical protein